MLFSAKAGLPLAFMLGHAFATGSDSSVSHLHIEARGEKGALRNRRSIRHGRRHMHSLQLRGAEPATPWSVRMRQRALMEKYSRASSAELRDMANGGHATLFQIDNALQADTEFNEQFVTVSEAGYDQVVASGNAAAMMAFLNKAVLQSGCRVTSRRAFKQIIPFYDGTCDKQSLANLMGEVHRGKVSNRCYEPWLAPVDDDRRYDMSLNEPLAKHKSKARRVRYLLEQRLQAAQDARSNNQTAQVIQDAVEELGGTVRDYGGLSGMVPFYSGNTPETAQPMSRLLEELESIGRDPHGWVKFGADVASISETGYRAVALMRDVDAMTTFIKRVLEREKLRVMQPELLQYLVSFHNGQCGSQSLGALIAELHSIPRADPKCGGGWISPL